MTTDRAKPATYRSFSIEQERDGTFSIFNLGYVAGHFQTADDARRDVDNRLDGARRVGCCVQH